MGLMARRFDIPIFYRSPIISVLKEARRNQDRYKKDMSPTLLDLGEVRFKVGRHFGFCFGVENAIDIAYRAIKENPEKRIYLLSEMIHNPHVNQDLEERGIQFIMKTDGESLIDINDLNADDIVIIPAFGTTIEMLHTLSGRGIDPLMYNTTCPFVEKVWNRSAQIGQQGFTVVIHGQPNHEETRATFSHAEISAPCLVIRDESEAKILASFIRKEHDIEKFDNTFKDRYSKNFDPHTSLERIGVVNQTTMLATETQAIARIIQSAVEIRKREGTEFADTRDTLCYATSENQDATRGLIASGGDLAVVVGGYNSSNTSHLVELLQNYVPTYFIKEASEILSRECIRYLDLQDHKVKEKKTWVPEGNPINILITSGASCPDALVDQVIMRIAEICGVADRIESALEPYRNQD